VPRPPTDRCSSRDTEGASPGAPDATGHRSRFGIAAYSAENNALPFHPRPAPADLGGQVEPVVVDHSSNVYARQTTQGTIEVDTATHLGRYVPRP
jgi:hypothetical protein